MGPFEQPWPDVESVALLSDRVKLLQPLRPARTLPELTDSHVLAALRSPLWVDASTKSLAELVAPGEKTCLVVSDHTRKTAAHIVLPLLLKEFVGAGCNLDDWFVVIASGIHRHPTPTETRGILGPLAFETFRNRLFMHHPDDPDALVNVGVTSRGHKVRVNRLAMEADRRIALGGVVFHYHAGFGGGRKSFVPGLAARDTIAFNHSLSLDPGLDRIHPATGPGKLDGNPVSEEMLEAARLCRPDAIVNTVLDADGRMVGVFAGDLDVAHRAACACANEALSTYVPEPPDLVVASAGSARNWIQSHKALYNAHCAVRQNGQVVLLAPCPEGIGDDGFKRWVCKQQIKDIYADLRKEPDVLGQTALSTRTRGSRTVLVTDMLPHEARKLGMMLAHDAAEAIRLALDRLDKSEHSKPTCLLMPDAMVLFPRQ